MTVKAKKTDQVEKKATEQPAEKNAPVHILRVKGVKVAAFLNTGKDGSQYHKVSLQKIYKEGDEFKTTTSLGRDDLPVACALMQDMWRWILDEEAARYKAANGGGE